MGKGRKHHKIQKKNIEWKDDTTKEQVVVSRLRMRYTRATPRHVVEKTPSPECLFCGVSLTTEHILWEGTETTREGREIGTTKEVWNGQMETKRISLTGVGSCLLFHTNILLSSKKYTSEIQSRVMRVLEHEIIGHSTYLSIRNFTKFSEKKVFLRIGDTFFFVMSADVDTRYTYFYYMF
jgi:hypothetical protein